MSLSTLGATLIPCPLCDALPYDNPRELASHLESECPGRNGPAAPAPAPEPTERRDPVRIGGSAETFTPVRSFSPGGTRATITPSAPIANPCSDKQEAFIRSLCDRTGADLPDFATLTKTAASKVIDGLKSQPAKAPAAPAAPSHGIELEHGRVYAMADGTFVKVVESKAGNLYGKLADADGKFTDYQKGLLGRIARNLTAEEAARFGHDHHRCVFCARTLTDEADGRSVEVGYGPICADKYGLPWG
jgi:hypothetical protein